jgi:hypothetical protein
MFGLTNEEIDYLKNCNRNIKLMVDTSNYADLQTEIDWYLTGEDCMYYDSDGQNWYTEKGKYVQSLYDKILDWKYSQE